MWKNLRRSFFRKSRLLTGALVFMFGIVGMFTQYQFFCMEASNLQWRPLMRMEKDWYYYRSLEPQAETDPEKQYIEETFETLGMRQMRTLHLYDVFQYSEEAWQKFDYPLAEGDGFSESDVNEVIVSRGLARQYPVGSKVEIECLDNYELSYGKVVESVECTVVGVLEQDSIFFRTVTGRGTVLEAGEEDMWSWKYGAATSEGKAAFCVVHPGKEWKNENCYDEAAGVFFRASDEAVRTLQIEHAIGDRITSVAHILELYGGYHYVVGYFRVSVVIVFWMIAMVFLFIWYRYLLNRSTRELAYLSYIGYDARTVLKRYGSMYVWLLPAGWLISCAAYFLPNNFDAFWRMHWYIPAVAIVLYSAVGAIGFGLFVLIFKNNMGKRGADALLASDLKHLYIEDLTMKDNLKAILLAQGYSDRAAANMARQMLVEKELAYCADRPMDRLSGEERLRFLECREKLREQS